MNYFASRLSVYVSAAIVVLGSLLTVIAQVQTLVPSKYALYVAAGVTVLGGLKALLSAIAAAIQSVQTQKGS